ncbi:MAG: hypothetical protein ACLVCW_01995 [Campylobacter sp.]
MAWMTFSAFNRCRKKANVAILQNYDVDILSKRTDHNTMPILRQMM